MKRMHLLALAFAGVLAATARLPAQDTAAILAAERQENEERFKTLNAKIDQLVEANEAYLKKLNRVTEELAKLKEEVDRSKNDTTKDTLKRLEEAIQEVDKQRMADNKLIVAEFAKLGRITTPSPPSTNSAKPPTPSTPAPRPPAGGEKGYEYLVKSGDTGGTILQFYRDQGVKITLRQLMEANPSVNWNKLKINQKIFVPISDK
jgi:TolA-binding protein